MKREVDDLYVVRPEHFEIHERLGNWARYVQPSRGGTAPLSMFRQYRSSEVWATAPAGEAVDAIDGHMMEKAVGQLPEKHRDAVRWAYVYWYVAPGKMCKLLGVGRARLCTLIHDARTMLRNRL